MKKPPIPENEIERLKSLIEKEILDTPSEKSFDRIVEMAAEICGTKYSAISLIDADRQWFKAKFGFAAEQTPREVSFCAHAILKPGMTEVIDAKADPRFAENPAVTGDPNVKFYAGVPLIDSKGYALGMLCVFDPQKRVLEDFQKTALHALAVKVMKLIENKNN
jgi:GAF domain-containing protein